MSDSELDQLEKNVQTGALIGIGSGLAIALVTKRGSAGYVGLGLLGGLIGLMIPIISKMRKVKPEPEPSVEKEEEPIPAPSLAVNEQMIVDGEEDFR